MRRLPNTYPGDITKYPTKRGTFSIGSADEGSKVLFYNETPVNLDLDFYNGNTDVLHAWEANFWVLDGEVGDITWAIDTDSLTVTNPPINAVFATVLNPNETLRDKAYPMPLIRQIGGQQAIVSSASQVINDGNALQQVVEATLQGHASSDVIINNDGTVLLKGGKIGQTAIGDTLDASDGINLNVKAVGNAGNINFYQGINLLWQMYSQGTFSYLFSSQNARIGDASHEFFATFLGDTYLEAATGKSIFFQIPSGGATIASITATLFHVFQALQVDGATNLTGLLTAAGQITGAAAQDLTLNAVTGQHVQFLINNVLVGSIDAAGLNFSSKKLFDTASHNLADWTGAGLFLKGNNANQSGMSYQANGTNTDFKLSCLSFFSGSGSVTANHGMTQFGAGQSPDIVVPVVNVAGSATMGFDSVTSTQVHITAGAALGWRAWGMR